MGSFLKRLFGKKTLPKEGTEHTSTVNLEPKPAEITLVESAESIEKSAYNEDINLSNYQFPSLNLLGEPINNAFIELNSATMKLPLLWSATENEIRIEDLAELQSILIAGTAGSGKTNLLIQFIVSLLCQKHPSQLKFVLFDYKGIDLASYSRLHRHFLAALPGEADVVVSDVRQAISTLNALCMEMDNRYELIKDAITRGISEYNQKFIEGKLNSDKEHHYLPSIILVVDNVEGFSTHAGKEIIMPLQRLVTMGYKAGIFVILSTSDLSYKALPGELLNLIQERIAFRLNSKEEYRKLYATTNVEILWGKGTFYYNRMGKINEGRSVIIAPCIVEEIVRHISNQRGFPHAFLLTLQSDLTCEIGNDVEIASRDPLFEDAARLMVESQIGSTSLLQRRLKLGYNRAGRLMNQLETAGMVGPYQGSKARDVLIKTEVQLQALLSSI